MALKVLESGRVEDIEGTMSELDKARREYDEEYQLADLIDEEETFTGVSLSKIIEPKDKDKKPFFYLEFYNDDEQTVMKVNGNLKFKTETPMIFKGSKLYPIVSALTNNNDEYIKINYKELQEEIAKIKEITITAVEIDTGSFEYVNYEVVDVRL